MRRGLVTALLFLFCAIPGLVAFFGGAMYTFIGFSNRSVVSVSAGVASAVVGSALILIGTRRWRQWLYLFVFVAFIAGVVFYGLLDPHSDEGLALLIGGGLAFFVSV